MFKNAVSKLTHNAQDAIELFNRTFAQTYNTRLVLGADEPLYKPASNRVPYHQVIFAHGFFRSALHEAAHWCVAGPVRRHIVDYAYWYKPDGRGASEQRQFERVECKPQALEWLFCLSAGHSFEVSCDNLGCDDPNAIDVDGFRRQVERQLTAYFKHGVPKRAQLFAQALQQFYAQPDPASVWQLQAAFVKEVEDV
ncbi:hypothetical protein B0I24_11620 [Aliidiomarina maris]|uniref:Elongation factor P hydroxylase n=1 Tax=Aliidiomarina maris TaxID=531312 RepID=A0A327WRK5_9GAMM|nr:hypothetical protein B0I24_11620 [Aliidiomarina maris]